MNATQQMVTAFLGALMLGTIFAMPAQLPGKVAAIRVAGPVTTLAPQKCQDQGLVHN
jgi:hypothetical protein